MIDEIMDSIEKNVPLIDLSEHEKTETTEDLLKIEAKKILKAKQQSNLGIILDHNYYCNIYFICENHKIQFLEKLGIKNPKEIYIDGYQLAKLLNINIELGEVKLPKPNYVKQFKTKTHGNKSKRSNPI